MVFIPLLRMKVQFWVYLLLYHFLYLLVNAVRNFLVLFFELEIGDWFVQMLLVVWEVHMLQNDWYFAIKSVLAQPVNASDCRRMILT